MGSRRAALFDGIEEGGIRATSSYPSHEIDEYDNNRALDGLQERVNILKGLTGSIHDEVESHNRMLDHMGNDMDSSQGILSGTMGMFKHVFETKSSRTMFTLVASFVEESFGLGDGSEFGSDPSNSTDRKLKTGNEVDDKVGDDCTSTHGL